MDIAATQSTNPFNATQSTSPERNVGKQNVNMEDFMKLLITQMTNQDPMEPVSDQEFMAQMAQFSSLEEMSGLNETMTNFVQQQSSMAAGSYLGREVVLHDANGEEISGLVTAVNSKTSDGKVTVTVDGRDYPLNKIQTVRLPEAAPNT